MKHTKGPYIVTEQANGLFSVYTNHGFESMADEILIAYNLTEANAKLIAAAPELLEALLKLMDYTQQGWKGVEAHPLEVAENAVRKATGLFSAQIKK